MLVMMSLYVIHNVVIYQ